MRLVTKYLVLLTLLFALPGGAYPIKWREIERCHFQALGDSFASTANPSDPAWPTGHRENDIALLVFETANEAVTLSPANGFVEIADSPQGTGTAGGTAATRLTVFWARATSGAMSAPGTPDSGNHTIGRLLTFRGCATSGDPWDVTAGDVASTASTSVSIPGDTTTGDNRLVVAIAVNATDAPSDQTFTSEANSSLEGFSVVDEAANGVGNGGAWMIAVGEKRASGAYSATTATLGTSSVQGRISLALKTQ